jgi:hypothetical protein
VPDFTANSTIGEIHFHDVSRTQWFNWHTTRWRSKPNGITLSDFLRPRLQFLAAGPGWTIML